MDTEWIGIVSDPKKQVCKDCKYNALVSTCIVYPKIKPKEILFFGGECPFFEHKY